MAVHASRLLTTQCSKFTLQQEPGAVVGAQMSHGTARMGDTVKRTIAIYGTKLQMNSQAYTRGVMFQHGLLPGRRVQVDACVRALCVHVAWITRQNKLKGLRCGVTTAQDVGMVVCLVLRLCACVCTVAFVQMCGGSERRQVWN